MTVVAVDLGRSGARVLRRAPGTADVRRTTMTGAGLGDPGGAATVAAALRAVVGDPPEMSWTLAVGVPGALTHRRAAGELADLLASGWAGPDPAEVAVTSDVVGWHAGAFRDRAGEQSGGPRHRHRRGGDGRRARRPAAARRRARPAARGHGQRGVARSGGPARGAAGPRRGGPGDRARGPGAADAHRGPGLLGALAEFAPAVLAAAEGGDGVARRIVADAVAALAATVDAAGGSAPGAECAVVGGLAHALAPHLAAARPELTWRSPDGDRVRGPDPAARGPHDAA